jgi:predicted nucleotidyltransferase
MMSNERTALEALTESLQSLPEVVKVVVFGSRVRGDFDASSDLDVMIIIPTMQSETRAKVIRITHDIELEYEVPISPILYTVNEYAVNKKLKSSFIEQVENEGIVLYDAQRT